jgi:hypothetical protein
MKIPAYNEEAANECFNSLIGFGHNPERFNLEYHKKNTIISENPNSVRRQVKEFLSDYRNHLQPFVKNFLQVLLDNHFILSNTSTVSDTGFKNFCLLVRPDQIMKTSAFELKKYYGLNYINLSPIEFINAFLLQGERLYLCFDGPFKGIADFMSPSEQDFYGDSYEEPEYLFRGRSL